MADLFTYDSKVDEILDEFLWEPWGDITPKRLGNFFLNWIIFRLTFDMFACSLQVWTDYVHSEVPPVLEDTITPERYAVCRLYRCHKLILRICHDAYIISLIYIFYIRWGALFKTWEFAGEMLDWIVGENWPADWDDEIPWTICFLFLVNLILTCIEDLPHRFIDAFIVERYWGFNQMGFQTFLSDLWHRNMFLMMLDVPAGAGIVYIVKHSGQYFYIYSALLFFVAFVCMVQIWPNYVVPMFDEVVEMPEGQLKREIRKFATAAGYPGIKIMVKKQSQKNAHSSVNFYKVFGHGTVVISDTLMKSYLESHPQEVTQMLSRSQMSQLQAINQPRAFGSTEITALVVHEIGHVKRYHRLYDFLLAFFQFVLFFTFYAFYYENSAMYEAFKFPRRSKKPIVIGLYIMVGHGLDTVNFAMRMLSKVVWRWCVLDADKYVFQMGLRDALKKALLNIDCDEMDFPVYHPLFYFYDNLAPTVTMRFQRLDSLQSDDSM